MVRSDAAPSRLLYIFSTCVYSSSTGVARPKIDTATFTRLRSSSTSSTVPVKVDKPVVVEAGKPAEVVVELK